MVRTERFSLQRQNVGATSSRPSESIRWTEASFAMDDLSFGILSSISLLSCFYCNFSLVVASCFKYLVTSSCSETRFVYIGHQHLVLLPLPDFSCFVNLFQSQYAVINNPDRQPLAVHVALRFVLLYLEFSFSLSC